MKKRIFTIIAVITLLLSAGASVGAAGNEVKTSELPSIH
jgi:hypothetical protein